jgi:hypothetical protein
MSISTSSPSSWTVNTEVTLPHLTELICFHPTLHQFNGLIILKRVKSLNLMPKSPLTFLTVKTSRVKIKILKDLTWTWLSIPIVPNNSIYSRWNRIWTIHLSSIWIHSNIPLCSRSNREIKDWKIIDILTKSFLNLLTSMEVRNGFCRIPLFRRPLDQGKTQYSIQATSIIPLIMAQLIIIQSIRAWCRCRAWTRWWLSNKT